MEYRKDIQGLRALAVIFVFLFHINKAWLPSGFIGVDIFFVLSGFLVSSIIINKQQQGNFSILQFYFKRIRRIVPAYYVMLIATAIATIFVYIGDDINGFRRDFLHAAVFDADRVYARIGSYFGAPRGQRPLLHTWTLGTEMKFYLLLPLMLLLPPKKYRFGSIALITIALFAYGIYQTEIINNASWAYFALPVRIPEFCMGVLLALKYDVVIEKLQPVKPYASYIGALLLLIGVLFSDEKHFPGFWVLLPCGGTLLLLLWESSPVNVLLSKKLPVYLGTLSYSVYLWHAAIINLTRYYNAGGAFSTIQYIMIVLLTALLSWLSFTLVEDKLRKTKPRAFWFGMVPIALGIGILLFTMQPVNRYFSTIPAEYAGPVFGMKSHNTGKAEVLGDKNTQPEIVLIGNSHALCLKPYLDYLGKKHHFSFSTVTTNSYPAINGIDKEEVAKKGRYGDYEEALRSLPVTTKKVQESKVIIMAMSSWVMVPSLSKALEDMAKGLKPGQQLLLVTPFPILDKDPLKVNRAYIKRKDIAQQYTIRYRKENQDLHWLEQKYANVHFIDLSKNDAFKNAPFYHDTLMYYNINHINSYGALVLAKNSEAEFMQVLDSLKQR